jgi:hypothetical protein
LVGGLLLAALLEVWATGCGVEPSQSGSRTLATASRTQTVALTTAGRPFVAFGPADYVRGTGMPTTSTVSFSVLNPAAPYTLQVTNGGLRGQYSRVSSGTVFVNGVQVIGPSDFNQTVARIEKPVTLALTDQLAVQLASGPGSGIAVQVIGLDSDPPSITATVAPPPNAAGWNNSNVTVTFTCSDLTSGVAVCPAPVALTTDGAGQVVSGTASDKAGNTASASVTVNLDETPPTVRVSSPTPGATLTTPTPTMFVSPELCDSESRGG